MADDKPKGFLESFRRPAREPAKPGEQPITPNTGLEDADFNPLPINPASLVRKGISRIAQTIPKKMKPEDIEQYRKLLASNDPLIRDFTKKHLEKMRDAKKAGQTLSSPPQPKKYQEAKKLIFNDIGKSGTTNAKDGITKPTTEYDYVNK